MPHTHPGFRPASARHFPCLVKADWLGKASDGYNTTQLEQPLVLEPCTEYIVASYENGAQDSFPAKVPATVTSYSYNATSGLLGYSGTAPTAISNNNLAFEVDNCAWIMLDDALWQSQISGSFLGNVNLKIQ